jgi:hypothetical protein
MVAVQSDVSHEDQKETALNNLKVFGWQQRVMSPPLQVGNFFALRSTLHLHEGQSWCFLTQLYITKPCVSKL